jgi:hypothetical protein
MQQKISASKNLSAQLNEFNADLSTATQISMEYN